MEKAQYTITHQPVSQAYMSATCPPPAPQGASGCCSKNKCHAHRLKVLLPALLALLTLASLAVWFWCSEGMSDLATDVGSTLWKRQSQESSFVKNKLYLIVIFVGLFLCLVLGILLSAWCCKGSFENPLCCPCYLCACCGGLACLQCLSCGLCCEGIDQINV
ncbi:hypothetical protein RSOLAG1IB_02185 [Rhizoctonia solani AG-1 IB]|uniref:Uncharacterized protein n=1 Tax=Thanatephorus cucumeris (strain AG1-IB / isolate 7/3/14) TaxID=1108050 RepID=A0A0B7FHH2_THACB|nr:hypothetical protein RSOLAG1IB_02185 [Rhizoctonia solani AG-1 IB]